MMEIVSNSSMSVVADNMNNDKYFHTTFLKEIGVRGQEKLLKSKVLVIGAGGLASPALIYLASMGVGHISVVDDDIVSISNLPRQIIFDEEDVDKKKVDVIKTKLEKKNKDISIHVYDTKIKEDNALDIIKGHDIVLECSDDFFTKFLVNDTCLELGIPFVIAGVSDYQGQVVTCIPHKSKDFKSLFSTLPIDIDDKYKEEDQGVFPPSIGVISDIACAEVIKCLLEIGSTLLDKMLIVNLLNNKIQIIAFPSE